MYISVSLSLWLVFMDSNDLIWVQDFREEIYT
jgi:hypothetical protein